MMQPTKKSLCIVITIIFPVKSFSSKNINQLKYEKNFDDILNKLAIQKKLFRERNPHLNKTKCHP